MFASQVTQSKSTLMVMKNANKDLKKMIITGWWVYCKYIMTSRAKKRPMEKTIVAICDKNFKLIEHH